MGKPRLVVVTQVSAVLEDERECIILPFCSLQRAGTNRQMFLKNMAIAMRHVLFFVVMPKPIPIT